MEYRRFNDTVIARIDRGEEIQEQLKIIAVQEHIRLASVEALGAVKEFECGVYDPSEKKYYVNHFEGLCQLPGTEVPGLKEFNAR